MQIEIEVVREVDEVAEVVQEHGSSRDKTEDGCGWSHSVRRSSSRALTHRGLRAQTCIQTVTTTCVLMRLHRGRGPQVGHRTVLRRTRPTAQGVVNRTSAEQTLAMRCRRGLGEGKIHEGFLKQFESPTESEDVKSDIAQFFAGHGRLPRESSDRTSAESLLAM